MHRRRHYFKKQFLIVSNQIIWHANVCQKQFMDRAYMVNKILAFGKLFGIICSGIPNGSIQINFPDHAFRSYLLGKCQSKQKL